MCPGNDESAGKRRSGKTTKGSQWLRTTLVQVAWAASHTKETIFSACYHRWVKRMGKKKALVAVAHKILVVIWHLLKKGTEYHERRAGPGGLNLARKIFRGSHSRRLRRSTGEKTERTQPADSVSQVFW